MTKKATNLFLVVLMLGSFLYAPNVEARLSASAVNEELRTIEFQSESLNDLQSDCLNITNNEDLNNCKLLINNRYDRAWYSISNINSTLHPYDFIKLEKAINLFMNELDLFLGHLENTAGAIMQEEVIAFRSEISNKLIDLQNLLANLKIDKVSALEDPYQAFPNLLILIRDTETLMDDAENIDKKSTKLSAFNSDLDRILENTFEEFSGISIGGISSGDFEYLDSKISIILANVTEALDDAERKAGSKLEDDFELVNAEAVEDIEKIEMRLNNLADGGFMPEGAVFGETNNLDTDQLGITINKLLVELLKDKKRLGSLQRHALGVSSKTEFNVLKEDLLALLTKMESTKEDASYLNQFNYNLFLHHFRALNTDVNLVLRNLEQSMPGRMTSSFRKLEKQVIASF